MSDRKHPHRAGRVNSLGDWITFLVTGPEANLYKFAEEACVEVFDRRGQTIRCRAHSNGEDGGEASYARALEAAKTADATMQDLVDTGKRTGGQSHLLGGGAACTVSMCVEEYPVVHLGTHGMKWGKT